MGLRLPEGCPRAVPETTEGGSECPEHGLIPRLIWMPVLSVGFQTIWGRLGLGTIPRLPQNDISLPGNKVFFQMKVTIQHSGILPATADVAHNFAGRSVKTVPK